MRPVDLSHEGVIVAKIYRNEPWREMTKTWFPRTVVKGDIPVFSKIQLIFSWSIIVHILSQVQNTNYIIM